MINIISAIQEDSSTLVTEALDHVLEILRTTELYSPQFEAKNEDPHANNLIEGLISVSALAGLWLEPAAPVCHPPHPHCLCMAAIWGSLPA